MRLVSSSARPVTPASDDPEAGVSTSGIAGADAQAVERALAARAQRGDADAFAALVEGGRRASSRS